MVVDEGPLIEALSEGVFERPLWHGFLERLRAQTNSVYAHLALGAFHSGAVVMLCSGEGPPPQLEDLVAKRRRMGSMPFSSADEGGGFGLDTLFHRSETEYEAACRAQLSELGIDYVRVQPVLAPNGTQGWLTCAGAREQEQPATILLARLAPHVKQALRTYAMLEEQKFTSAITIEAARRANFGWLTLDHRCRVLDSTPELELAFDQSQPMWRGEHDRLHFRSPTITHEVKCVLALYAGDPAAKPRALILSRDPWMDMLIAPVQHRRLATRETPVAILYLRRDRWSQADRCEQLAELFGLSPRDAQMAWALAQGMTIAEAAGQLGITLETARSYSKRVYFKTGARGQAELVRTILTSVLAIA
ncbi:MAG TPA: helix-turn-helix transcriptional regulator [Novosphingobium sp.]|nr:helix-turn-helix transcriptional regulator [Novosphingobium sp.]